MQIITNDQSRSKEFESKIANYFLDVDPDGTTLEAVFSVSIIADYITDGPDYSGPVYFVLFSGAPEFHQVFVEEWREREFVRLVPIERSC